MITIYKERIQKERKLKIIRLTTVITLLSILAGIAVWGWIEASNETKRANDEKDEGIVGIKHWVKNHGCEASDDTAGCERPKE